MNNKLWLKAVNGEVVINCNSKKECDDYLYMCNKKKVTIANEVRDNAWENYKNNVCFRISHNDMYFGSLQYFEKSNSEIVTYTELMKETFTGSELAQLLRDKKFKEGTKFCDEYGTIYSVVSLLTGFDIRHNGSPVNSYIIINGTFTLIEEPKFYFLNQAIKSNKQIKLKDWENYHDIEQALIHLSRLSKETIQEALTMQVWEVEE